MKKTIGAVLLALVLLLTGCSSDNSHAPKPVVSADHRDEDFVTVIRDEIPSARSAPEQDIIGAGKAVCGALDRGVPLARVGAIVIHEGFSPGDAGYFIGASISVYCPQHKDLIPDSDVQNT